MSRPSTFHTFKPHLFFLIFLLAFGIFLVTMFRIAFGDRDISVLKAQKTTMPLRGDIYDKEGYLLATSERLYKVSVDTRFIAPDATKTFVDLLAKHTRQTPQEIAKKITKKGYVTLSYRVKTQDVPSLKKLSKQLIKEQVLTHSKKGNKIIRYGLVVEESGERRIYPYGNRLTPILGYVGKKEQNDLTQNKGIKGLENYYEDDLSLKHSGLLKGNRDIRSNIIFNKDAVIKGVSHGAKVYLNVPLRFQIKVEDLLDGYRQAFKAQEVIAGIVNAKTGEVLTLASSNRFDPSDITKKLYGYLNVSAIEYMFEPGSVFKPIVLAKILEEKLAKRTEVLNGYKGQFELGSSTINDVKPQAWVSVDNAIVYSSNIVMAQLANRLTSEQYLGYLEDLDFGKKTNIDLPYERFGDLPSNQTMSRPITKATVSYGYGVAVNFMQLLKVYTAFANGGVTIDPKLVNYTDLNGKKTPKNTKSKRIVSQETAQDIQEILIKTFRAKHPKADYGRGVEVGAKTGTAHIARNGQYAKEYISSMFGFVRDGNNSYALGVTTYLPQGQYFASQTSRKVFNDLITYLTQNGYIKADLTTP